ncbi:MAG: histone deacetylase family protein [Solirubrobacteraceae bacterium]
MAPQPVFLEHPSSLEHDTGEHPECAARLRGLDAELQRRSHFGYRRVSSPAVERAVLELVHPASHIERVESLAAAGGGPIGAVDEGTIVSPRSYVAALHAAGGAVELVRLLLEGGAGQVGFSAHRPPGHHATATEAMGFCLFNNVAVAARHALENLGLDRVMVFDWDVHHGNGTNDIFWETDQVLFVSIHQWPLYPGTGRACEIGAGGGEGYTVNLPVAPGTGDDAYVSLVRDVVVPLGRAYAPQLILVSAGFDPHIEDPLAQCACSDAAFPAMATLIRDLAAELEVPLGCVLEGGYAIDALARCAAAVMQALLPGVGAPAAGAGHPLARDALLRLRPYWPDLPGPGPAPNTF